LGKNHNFPPIFSDPFLFVAIGENGSILDEHQRCWFVAVEASQYGYGGVRRLLSQVSGMDKLTIERRQQEMEYKVNSTMPISRHQRQRRRFCEQ
jgi:hypothetical protein